MIETAANLQSSGSVAQTVALILALAGAIAAALLFLSPKKRPAHRGFWRKVSAFVNFDRFLISSILKFLYVFATLYAVVYGLVLVFTGSLVTGLLLALLGPVALRVTFELLLLMLSIREDVAEAGDLLRRMQGLPPKYPPQAPAQPAQRQPAQPQVRGAAPDPRYAQQRSQGYPQQQAGPGNYGYPPRPPQTYPTEFGLTQRYAPIRNTGYSPDGYEPQPRATNGAQPGAPLRPTPADGTGRFSALPHMDSEPAKKSGRAT